MMSRTFGAPFGGTTRGTHQGVDSVALSLITPPNLGGNGGSCFPSSEVVALGDPRAPVTFDLPSCSPSALSDFVPTVLRLKCSTRDSQLRVLTTLYFWLRECLFFIGRHLHDFVGKAPFSHELGHDHWSLREYSASTTVLSQTAQ
jgi:hypothetical protein